MNDQAHNSTPQPSIDGKVSATHTTPAGVEVTETTEVVTRKPGLFGRIGRAIERNPVKTALTAAVSSAVGAVGVSNYRYTGSVTGGWFTASDAADVVHALHNALTDAS